MTVPPPPPPVPVSLAEIARIFLKLGTISFGGPAAHIALMREELVRRRGWLSDAEYLDLVGASALIPGPNSTEVAIHVGAKRGGVPGLLLAGACFILPAVVVVLAVAWAYVRYQTLPATSWLLYGIAPVIVAIVAVALWGLARTAVKGPLTGAIGIAAVALALLGINELVILAGSALAALAGALWQRRGSALGSLAGPLGLLPAILTVQTTGGDATLWRLFLFFLRTGSVLFGSGYVLLAFLQADLVERWGWLTEQQLLDAVAVGQFTPGPVFTTATFIGYVVAGWPGALLATVGIFLPAFFFVWLTHPLIPRLRRSSTLSALLDGVNVGSLGLMAAVTLRLGRAALTDAVTVVLALVTLALLLRFRVNSAWLVLGGGAAGLAWRGLT